MAIWGLNMTPRHCEEHKQVGEQNLVEARCVSCNLLYVLDTKGLCENCNPKTFESGRLAKQNALMAYLDTRGFTGDGTDVMVDSGVCGKERPDRVFDLGDKVVILECDEDQHAGRPCACEQGRMVNLGQAFGGLPVYFIRWNPDKYKGGDTAVKTRHKMVGDLLDDVVKGRHELPEVLTAALYMYYNGWTNMAQEKWVVLN